jgi:TRAP-type C4-dicarboxylate transport system substrate-binding protein
LTPLIVPFKMVTFAKKACVIGREAMTPRKIGRLFAQLAVCFTLLGLPSALAQTADYPTMTFKAGHPFPASHVIGQAFELFAKRVSELSGGKIKVELFPGSSLVTSKNELDALGKGIVDFGTVSWSYHAGELPYLDNATYFPFLYDFKSLPVLFDRVRPLMEAELNRYKIKLLTYFPVTIIYAFNKPIDPKAPDLTGMKIRTGGGAPPRMIRLLGGSTVDVPPSDLAVAIRSGVVNGLVTSIFSWHLSGVDADAAYMYWTEDSVGFTSDISVNRDRFNKWPPAVQKLVEKAAYEAGKWSYDNLPRLEGDVLVEAAKNPKVKIHKLSPEEVAVWRKKLRPIVDDFMKQHGDKAVEFVKIADEARKETSR